MRRGIAWGLLAFLVGLSAFLAPPIREDWQAWGGALLVGDWEGVDPVIVAHFNLMGLWPLVFGALLAPSLRARPLPAWPFVLGSMAGGAFVLLPWFGLRGDGEAPERGALERILTSTPVVGGLGAMATGTILWALATGSVGAWEQARGTEGFMYIMTLDFGVLWLASLLEARAQGEARGSESWRWAAIPLVGACIWVWSRERA